MDNVIFKRKHQSFLLYRDYFLIKRFDSVSRVFFFLLYEKRLTARSGHFQYEEEREMKSCKTLVDIRESLGLSSRVIQGYEDMGLIIPSGRNKYGHLLYNEETVKRIAYIRFYQLLGFSLQEIGEFIDAPANELRKILIDRSEIFKRKMIKQIEEYHVIRAYIDDPDDEKYEKSIMQIIKEDIE